MKKILSCILVMLALIGQAGCEEKSSKASFSPAAGTGIYIRANAGDSSNESVPDKPREDLGNENADSVYSNYECMRVHYLNVGQGDCAFIELANGQTMLIDAGNQQNGADIVRYIKDLRHSDIDFVVATHPHADHIGGMAEVLQNFKIGKMYMPKKEHTSQTFENMLSVIEEKNIELYLAKAGSNIMTSGIIKIDILAPASDCSYSGLNNYSAVVKITYGETVFLFMGDAEQAAEISLLNSDIDADVLKTGHHGSDTSSSDSFIQKVTPRVAVISAGKGNSYGHPDDKVLAVLNRYGAEIYRTDESGTVVVTADSHKKISVDKKASAVKENAPPLAASQNENKNANDNKTTVVFRTKTGKKYHMNGCSYLKSKIETTVEEAQTMGLMPCSRCNSPR